MDFIFFENWDDMVSWMNALEAKREHLTGDKLPPVEGSIFEKALQQIQAWPTTYRHPERVETDV